jgi:predicted aspartyl protease/cytochrome c-type biogenesis protein CcmH/NrfG
MKRLTRRAVVSLLAFAFAAGLVLAGGGRALAASNKKARAAAERALRTGDFEGAEKMYRDILAKDGRDNEARLGLGHSLLKQRKNQEAYDQAARVVTVEPLSARAHSLLGAALLASGDFRLSVEEFRTALSFKDDDAMAIAGMAMVDFYENRLAASLAGLRRAAFLDAAEPDYHFFLGQVAARYERYAEAASAYEHFLRVAPHTDTDRRERIRGLIAFLRYLGTQRDLNSVGGANSARLRVEVVNNRPMIDVRVNGSKEALRFVVDSGSGMCVIAARAAERLGLKPVARGGMARAVGGAGRFEIVYGFLQSIHLGEARIDRVPVYIRQFFNDQEQVDGYIGLSVLAKYLATIDYAGGTMTLLRDAARPPHDPSTPPPGIEIPIRTTSSGFWSGEFRVDGVEKPVNFIVDTGATVTVVSQALAAREDLARFERGARIRVYGAAGLADNIKTLMLPRVELGPHARKNVYAAVLDMDSINETAGFEQTGIIGGNILRHFRLTFDFERAVIRLEPQLGDGKEDDTKGKAPVVTSQG